MKTSAEASMNEAVTTATGRITPNHLALIALLALTALSYLAAETGSVSSGATVLVLGAMTLKFLGISFLYMELSRAHWLWKALALIYILMVATGFLIALR